MARKTERVADWSVALILLMVFSVAAGFTPRERIDWSVRRISGAVALLRPSRGIERSDVIVLSGEANDRFAVGATLEPRGYIIHHASSAGQAIAEMQRQPGRIAMVIVDETAPGARGALLAARKICPEACPVLLKGHRAPAQVASIVAGALDRHLTPSQSNELHQEASLHK